MIERYPLKWPLSKKRTPPDQRKRALFSSKKAGNSYSTQLSISEAVKRLMAEIRAYTGNGHPWRIDPDDVVISTNLKYRQDGLPYSNQKAPDDVGVAVYFTLDDRPYCLPCDKWDRIADNIAAIAAHIGAMRGIERWGVGESQDAYAGFKALPESTEAEKSIWEILGLTGKPATIEDVKIAYRYMASVYHPDKPTGSHDKFTKLQVAYNKALKLF